MVWRVCAFLFFVPPGLAFGLAFAGPASSLALVATSGILSGIVGLVIGFATPGLRVEPSRAALALATGAAGLPLALAAWLGIGSAWIPLGLWAAATTAWCVFQSQREDSVGAGSVATGWVAACALGGLLVGLVGYLHAAPGTAPPTPEDRRRIIFDLDAAIATEPRPDCAQRVVSGRVLADKGANPRIGPAGRHVWIDASTETGRRQIHRLDPETGVLECWSCGLPGNNIRPVPGPGGASLVFETDRHATWRTPADREIYLATARTPITPANERRLTRSPATDAFPVFGPSARAVIWSRAEGGRHDVVSASIGSGHGGFVVGMPGVLYRSGAAWVAPIAWSLDARHLLIARGGALGRSELVDLDPATGDLRSVGIAPSHSTAGFSRDGGFLARPALPDSAAPLGSSLGFVLGPMVAAGWIRPDWPGGVGIATGPSEGEGAVLPAHPLLDWGSISGVAISGDARHLIVSQRREAAEGREERLVELELECDRP